jgi:hypothetical protein
MVPEPDIYQKKQRSLHGFLLSDRGGETVSGQAFTVQQRGLSALAL